MRILDIAFKDMLHSFRSAFAIMFMFGLPLLMTGMFYFMFGNIASGGEFNLPKIKVVIANLDEGGPRFQVSAKSIPGGAQAHTMGELIVAILQSEDMADLVEVSLVSSEQAARSAVDEQAAQVAIIIPADFSKKFADKDAQATIQFYRDPTLTVGPGIIRALLNRFMDGMASVKIAANVFLDEAAPADQALAGQVVEEYMDTSLVETKDLAGELLAVSAPGTGVASVSDKAVPGENLLVSIIGPIMLGMMVFYAFFTASSSAQSILREEEERTLPRLFTTPTPQAAILSGKFLSVLLTVLVQVVVLIVVARLVFGIRWGEPAPVGLAAAGLVLIAASFGICVNSFLKNTKQSGTIFGGVLVLTGMLGMISVFAPGSPGAETLSGTVALLVPQGWAIRGLMQAMHGAPLRDVALTSAVMLVLSTAFFVTGVWRFNKRYA
jgi:ABC-2 type transport system permease protein